MKIASSTISAFGSSFNDDYPHYGVSGGGGRLMFF
jgi:hypothetical protein